MIQLSVSEARSRLTALSEELEREGTIAITSRGKLEMALMKWEVYEALMETIEILGDDELMSQLRKSIRDVEDGKLISLEALEKEFE